MNPALNLGQTWLLADRQNVRLDTRVVESSDFVRLADVIRVPKMQITFDYDSWRFAITTEKLAAADAGVKAAVVERAGKAPEQYPSDEW